MSFRIIYELVFAIVAEIPYLRLNASQHLEQIRPWHEAQHEGKHTGFCIM